MAHLFKFPRKIAPAVKQRYDLLRLHGKSRKSAAAFICGIGGYYADRYDRFPVSFNVKMYPDLDADDLWPVVRDKCDFGINEWAADKQVMAEHLFREKHKENENHLFSWAQEDMVRSAKEDDWFQENWLGIRVPFEWNLYGRGGGHLCLEEVDGFTLKGMNDDELYDRFGEKENGRYVVDVETIKQILVVCIELTVMTQGTALEEECQYKAAWTLWANICESEFDERWKMYETRDRLSVDANEIYMTLIDTPELDDSTLVGSFLNICRLAGVAVPQAEADKG